MMLISARLNLFELKKVFHEKTIDQTIVAASCIVMAPARLLSILVTTNFCFNPSANRPRLKSAVKSALISCKLVKWMSNHRKSCSKLGIYASLSASGYPAIGLQH